MKCVLKKQFLPNPLTTVWHNKYITNNPNFNYHPKYEAEKTRFSKVFISQPKYFLISIE